jgi:two-component system sensor histidine kinase PhcS
MSAASQTLPPMAELPASAPANVTHGADAEDSVPELARAGLTRDQQQKFIAEDRTQTLRNAAIGAWIIIFMVPACTILDYAAYPQHYWTFLLLRMLCSLCGIPILLALKQPWAKANYRAFPVILPIVPAFFIGLMIYISGEAHSGYYAGLTLCIVGSSFVFHWTYKELAWTLGIIFGIYLATTIPNLRTHDDHNSLGLFVNNTTFMLCNCVIFFISSKHHYATRIREFANRCVVEQQSQEIVQQNQELTETLTLLKSTEAQLDHSEKLASIGRLTAGIIHEINNPLNYMKSAIYVLKKRAKKAPPEISTSIDSIVSDLGEGLDRVASIVSDLRTFSHPENRPMAPTRLSAATTKATRFIVNEVQDRNATLTVDVPEHLIILADENHLIQIIINLVQNSLDALTEHPAPEVNIKAFECDGEVTLSIRDNGQGISQENITKIFDPFFTTKEVGKGMGLGLSLCYRMVQQMGGTIHVESCEGEFTQFSLSFASPYHPTQLVEP